VAIRVGKGRSAVTISGPLADGIERDVMALLGPVGVALQEEADKILADAAKVWPIKSGDSLKAWKTVLTVDPGTWKVEISRLNHVAYTKFIKSTKRREDEDRIRYRSPLVAHIRRPATVARRALKKSLVPLLEEAVAKALES